MSKDVIKKRDLKKLAYLQALLMEFIITPGQRHFLETELKTERSPFWDGSTSWNKAFFKGVAAANGRIHDILDAITGQKTKYHHGGLTVRELFKLATTMGINRDEAETNKKLLWTQISHRISSNISKKELKWILAELIAILTENEVKWLKKNSAATWKDFQVTNGDWVVKNTATITEIEILIEDIIGMTVKTVASNHHPKLTKADLLAVEKKIGIAPPTSQIFSKGLIKARILKKIQDDIFLRRAGITGTITQNYGIV